jgi:hypothetical protein
MAHTVIIHLANEDPIVAEIEELPDPTATCISCTEPRRRDGKPVHYISPEAGIVLFPWSRITFIEVMSGPADRGEVLEFYRE